MSTSTKSPRRSPTLARFLRAMAQPEPEGPPARLTMLRPKRAAQELAAVEFVDRAIAELRDCDNRGLVFVCPAIGALEVVPSVERFELGICSECGGPVWVLSRLREAVEAAGQEFTANCLQTVKGTTP